MQKVLNDSMTDHGWYKEQPMEFIFNIHYNEGILFMQFKYFIAQEMDMFKYVPHNRRDKIWKQVEEYEDNNGFYLA